MRSEVTITGDGSSTLYVPELDEHYHSTHGAVQESQYVFIEKGLNSMSTRELTIFEFGFGTGLNVLLSMLYANDRKIFYHAMELHPLAWSEVEPLGYSKFLKLSDDEEIRFSMIHSAEWNHEVKIKKGFYLKKIHGSILNTILDEKYDLIYYDAFAPAVQPELWGEQVFLKLYDSLKPGGRLVTYCAKGEVRRIMISAGFKVERLPGPPGKREILRATKNC